MIAVIAHPVNWYAGWALLLAGFATGAAVGIFFHREDFWGGYASLRRRLVRLGHIALAALGIVNVVFAVSVPSTGYVSRVASALMIFGAMAMPLTCFLTGWKPLFRHLFVVPVMSLVIAVVLVLYGGLP